MQSQKLDICRQRLNKLSGQSLDQLSELLNVQNSHQSESAASRLTACYTAKSTIKIHELNAFLKLYLAKHCVPSDVFEVDALPVHINGKLDRTKLNQLAVKPIIKQKEHEDFSGLDDFFENDSTFVPAETEIEKVLAAIWSEVLGITEISMHDNFLEVGGDSLLSIRILARIHKSGLSISTADFFTFPTIAAQAKVTKCADKSAVLVGKNKGKFAITPIQQWFFDSISTDVHHWGQNVLFSVPENHDYQSLQRAVHQLLSHHDVLRSVFSKEETEQWQQEILPISVQLPSEKVALKGQSEQDINREIDSVAQKLNAGFDLTSGGLIRFAYFEHANWLQQRLLIVIHHLIIDAVSWRILCEDLAVFWRAFAVDTKPQLNNKTSSFQLWSESLSNFSQSADIHRQLPFWLSQLTHTSHLLPVDFPVTKANNIVGSISTKQITVSIESTNKLLRQLSTVHKFEVKDVLVSALGLALQQWTGSGDWQIDIEGHGREALFEQVDLTSSIGWFTTVFPFLIKIAEDLSLLSQVAAIKQSLANIPSNGIGFGVLKELALVGSLKDAAPSVICLNYLGQVDQLVSAEPDTPLLKIIDDNIGNPRSIHGERAYYFEINARIQSNELVIDWTYSTNLHKDATVVAIVNLFEEYLDKIIGLSIVEPLSDELHDLDISDLEEGELDHIAHLLNDIE